MSKVTDNVELDFPARMSDGRQFTDYRPNCQMNYSITGDRGSWIERQYLIHNAESVHEQMMAVEREKTACTKCTDNTVLPVKTYVTCYPDTCKYNVVNKEGLGQGIDYRVNPNFLK
tara:strand:+ start:442 stop:789 length:348 start_codon:yes stop_codon:yes gene_type:complete